MESLKQLVDLYKDIDVRMHSIYANVIHNRWAAFEQNWDGLQRELGQYLTVAKSIRERASESTPLRVPATQVRDGRFDPFV
jgi:hypothetical protein